MLRLPANVRKELQSREKTILQSKGIKGKRYQRNAETEGWMLQVRSDIPPINPSLILMLELSLERRLRKPSHIPKTFLAILLETPDLAILAAPPMLPP